jgi:HK97 family phage portal protein
MELRGLGSTVPAYAVGRPVWPDRNLTVLRDQGYNQSATVYGCVQARAKAVSAATLRVYRDEGGGQRAEVDNHPLRELLLRPNPYMSEAEFLLMTSTFMDVAGFAIIEKVRSTNGRVVELWHLRPDWAKPIMRDQAAPDWEYRIPGRGAVTIAADDVLVITGTPSATMSPTGLSPISVALRELGIENSATDFLKLFFDNGAAPRYALVSPTAITDQAKADAIKERWAQSYGGFQNWVNVALLHSGLDLRQVGFDMNEMAYPELRRLTEARICTAFGVPAILIGAQVGLDASTYSNFEEARRTFYEDTVGPLWARIDGAITRDLLPEFGAERGISVEFDTSNIPALRDDVNPAWGRATAALSAGAITINQAQLEMGLPGFGPGGDVLLMPSSVIPVPVIDIGMIGELAAAARPQAAPTVMLAGIGPAPQPAMITGSSPRENRAWEYGGPEHVMAWEEQVRRTAPGEDAIGQETRRLMRDQREAVLARLNQRAAGDVLDDPFDLGDWIEVFRVALRPRLSRVINAAGRAAASDLKVGYSFDIEAPGVQRAIDRQAQTFAKRVNETTWDRLKASLAEGYRQGEGADILAQRVEQVMGDRIESDSLTIARTETTRAYNEGTRESWRQSGVVAGKRWISALDERTRETHIEAHGQVVGIDEWFMVGAGMGTSPGQIGLPEEDINCRCSMTAVLASDVTD